MLELVERNGGVVTASLPVDVDFHTGPAIRSAGEALLTDDCRVLILDASSVECLDSSGITVILGFWRRLEATGGTLILATPDEHVQARLVMLGLDTVLSVTDSVTKARVMAHRTARADTPGARLHALPGTADMEAEAG
ncbi:STAS domain-containing protein [Streptomyces sp. NPDC086091]|uniref:STAS domain-containing protein n=1 Tax=Streptomyces sp. NPDC086091 TaxID=3365751 RepID=UPI0038103876